MRGGAGRTCKKFLKIENRADCGGSCSEPWVDVVLEEAARAFIATETSFGCLDAKVWSKEYGEVVGIG